MGYIDLKNVTFAYSDEEKPVLKNVSLSLNKGDGLILCGDNGSGKTTLIRILNGLSFPDSGSYKLQDVEITKKYLDNNSNMKAFHKRVGYLFQNPEVMLFNGRVYDEIAFGPRQMGLDENEVKERVTDCLKLFNIESLSEKAPYHLSGGQKKKVALASVLSLNPEIIIMDEPFAGLDRKSKQELKELITRLRGAGKTFIIATHEEMLMELGNSDSWEIMQL